MSYNAYLNGNKVAEELTKPTHKFTGLKPATEYSVQFSVVENGLESDLTEALKVTTKPATVLPSGVKLNKNTLYLIEGGSDTLSGTVSPSTATDKKVTWNSKDKGVATVSTSGVVKAIKAGETEITVTTHNGKTDKCTVHVTEPVIKVKTVTINQSAPVLAVGESVDLTATVKPDNATDRDVYWTSSAPDIVDVSPYTGKAMAKEAGKAIITATADGVKGTVDATVVEIKEGE